MSKLSSSPTSKDSNFFKQQLMSDSLQNGQCLTKKKKKSPYLAVGKELTNPMAFFSGINVRGISITNIPNLSPSCV